jgi:hypothetical protein
MHFLAEGGAALHVTQGKPCCAATTGTKEMLSPNRSDASHLPSAGLERRGREGKGQAKVGQKAKDQAKALRESTFPKAAHLLRNQRLEKQDLGGTSKGNHLR